MFGFSKCGHHQGGEHHEGQRCCGKRMHRGGRHHMAAEGAEAVRGGRRGRGDKMHRLFEHGDLRIVLLALVDKKPSHGYELIKAIEEASSGLYVPSPGVIYPTLTLLEEQDFVTPVATGNGRKSYQITDAGKVELQQNQQIVDVIFNQAITLSYKRNYIERVAVIGLMRKLVKALLLILAVIFIFGNLGFDLTTGIAALGIGGLALALGAQKTIENLVGSVVVVTDAPVSIGDYCKFENYEGTVVDIGIRSSQMRTLTRTIVTVPNGDFSSIPIENFTARDMYRFYHPLYIKRDANINLVSEMIEALEVFLIEHELTNNEWNQVYLTELRQDCYVIQMQAYINAEKVTGFYRKQNALLVEVLNKVAEYEVEHALPTQQLLVNHSDEHSAKV